MRYAAIALGFVFAAFNAAPAFATSISASTILADFNTVIYTNLTTSSDIEGAAVVLGADAAAGGALKMGEDFFCGGGTGGALGAVTPAGKGMEDVLLGGATGGALGAAAPAFATNCTRCTRAVFCAAPEFDGPL